MFSEMDPDKHDGSYELMRETIKSYSKIDLSDVTILDLNAVYGMALITTRLNVEKKKEYINKGILPEEEKEKICGLLDEIWDKACRTEYENCRIEKKIHNKTGIFPTIGMFGSGFYSFKNTSTDQSAKEFIKMCIDIATMTDDQEMFDRAEFTFDAGVKGMQAASASVILHCLKPFTFPIMNGNMGNDNIYLALGIELDNPAQLSAYVNNCRAIKKFRDANVTFKNYRIFDLAARDLQKYEDSNSSGSESSDDNDDNKGGGEMVTTIEPLISAAKGGINKIFYGAPGCGKSYYVKKLIEEAGAGDEDIFRVTFHPEYTNTDFVGQILPSIEESVDKETGKTQEIVTYQFNPGPFVLALQRAFSTKNMVYLVIEEINRGNAAAIFGDLFQLLDREKDTAKDGFSSSEYPIRNVPVQNYLLKVSDSFCTIDAGILKKGLIIPGNLTIFATMNSSDQNVFTLDTAFKRRWYFEQISNDIVKDPDHKYKNWYIPGTDVTWERFMVALNDKILDYKLHNQTNEDKRLGKYFVTTDCLTENVEDIEDVSEAAENFAYKVLEYIWNDVCKIGREEWFDTEKNRTLEELIDSFITPDEDNSPLDIFENIEFESEKL